MKLRNVPLRLATGAYVLHSGWEKWHGNEAQATGLHGMASGAFPAFKPMKPTDFLRMLSVGEIALGSALLAPFVPAAVVGIGLTGFSGALVTMYLRTDGLHRPGTVWPTSQGTAISKDVWMLGIGLSLIADGASRRAHE
ncbi:hypothetical protein [Nocardioides terrisoli]|uniref:hypothetical protein n=1 Tax=Nocardioides terrisoli TaxID=3388267 RepID=UPI00287B7164|nr:hypothetical protein [Nocardioides marmorisolisilvae]